MMTKNFKTRKTLRGNLTCSFRESDWQFARVEYFLNLISKRMEEEMNVLNLVENNYAVIESWGVVIADKIWGQGGSQYKTFLM